MLKVISPLFSPELLADIYRMGHGDEIVLADAHFPGHSTNNHVIRADGLQIEALMEAILPLFALDEYVDDPVVMMQCVPGDVPDSAVEAGYRTVIDKYAPQTPKIKFIERFDFYNTPILS
jgi:L-fucose mutarotase